MLNTVVNNSYISSNPPKIKIKLFSYRDAMENALKDVIPTPAHVGLYDLALDIRVKEILGIKLH
jgi:hypothetical protein